MRLTAVATAAAVCLLSATALSGCTASTPDARATPSATAASTPEPTVRSAYNAGKPESCETWSAIRFAPRHETDTAVRVWLEGPELTDHGPLEFAAGDVSLDSDGHPETYTVAAGDSGLAIGERFCADYITVFQFNDVYPVPHPGDVLALRVDESVLFPVDPIDGS